MLDDNCSNMADPVPFFLCRIILLFPFPAPVLAMALPCLAEPNKAKLVQSLIPIGAWLNDNQPGYKRIPWSSSNCAVSIYICDLSHPLLILSSLNIVIDERIFIMVASHSQGGKASAPMVLLIYFRLSSHSVSLIPEDPSNIPFQPLLPSQGF